MSTTKTIKIQKNKILTYSINKSGFQTVNKTITVTGDTTITEEMVSTTGSKIQQLGDRLLGISTYVCDFIPSGTYDIDSLKFITASQTTGTGLSNIQVVKGTSNTEGETQTWLSKVEKELSIVTPKGTSKIFVFTYNGVTWDITGDLILSGQDISDYGITFTGTASSGNVITVTETHYNKFACYVLDSNYRSNQIWGPRSTAIMPIEITSNPLDCEESATYFNNYVINNLNISDCPLFNYCKNLGNFIVNPNIIIKSCVPNMLELKEIWNNRIFIDECDPSVIDSTTPYNLQTWNFATGVVRSCLEYNETRAWCVGGDGSLISSLSYGWDDKMQTTGCCPIFEVPVM